MLCSQHTKGVATTQRQTGLVERIVCTAVEHTAYVAHAVQAVDDVTISVQCLTVGVGVHTGANGRHADVLADAPEGSLLDLVHIGALLTNAGLKAATVQYAKTRPVFEQYKATKYSRKFLAEHEADLELYRAAQAEMRSLLGGAKLPKMDVLKEEGRKLTAKKKQLYGEYQKARRDMQEIVTIKANIDTLMGYTEPGRKQEKER